MCWKSHLFQSEDVLVEVELNLFISDVDTQLLEWVLLEVLETKDVQNPHVHHAVGRTSKTQKAKHYPTVITHNALSALMTHTTEYFTTRQPANTKTKTFKNPGLPFWFRGELGRSPLKIQSMVPDSSDGEPGSPSPAANRLLMAITLNVWMLCVRFSDKLMSDSFGSIDCFYLSFWSLFNHLHIIFFNVTLYQKFIKAHFCCSFLRLLLLLIFWASLWSD